MPESVKARGRRLGGTFGRVTGFAGVVLTGGRSSRMGTDKAFVEVDGGPMAAAVLATLRDAGAASVAAVGGDVGRLAGLGFDEALPDRYPGQGPLGGVLTALEAAIEAALDAPAAPDVVVIVACDMPWLTAVAVRELVGTLERNPAAQAAVGHDRSDRVEPMFAAWRPAACHGPLTQAFAAGERALHAALGGLVTCTVTLEDPMILRSVNRPGDLPG